MAVHTGDVLSIQARIWNKLLSLLEPRLDRMADKLEAIYQPSIIWIKNTSANNLDRGDVLGIDSPLVSFSDNSDWFKESMEWSGSTPSTSTPHYGQYCVMREACPAGEVRRAVVAGVALAKLNITHAADLYCEIANGVATALTTGPLGSSKILWKSSGTGSTDKWGLIRVGEPSGEILVKNNSGGDYSAGSSCTTLEVHTGTPGSESTTGQTITAYNKSSVAFKNGKYGSAAILQKGNAYVSPQQT